MKFDRMLGATPGGINDAVARAEADGHEGGFEGMVCRMILYPHPRPARIPANSADGFRRRSGSQLCAEE